MKRCPQCEFIYEDDQSLCDMDGKALVYEARQPDLPRGTTAGASLPIQKSRPGSLTPLVAGLILATVLFLIFYASPGLLAKPESPTQKPATKNSPEKQKPESNPQPATAPPDSNPSAPVPPQSPTSAAVSSRVPDDANPVYELGPARTTRTKTNHTTPKPTDSRLTISRRLPPLPSVQPLPRLPEAKVAEQRAQPISAPPKPSVAHPKSVETPRSSTQRPAVAYQKKESKVSSFLKNTGRILSKPFKF